MVSSKIKNNQHDDSVPRGFIYSINIFVCRYFYSIINSHEFKRELIENQQKLAPAQIDRLANDLIDIIVNQQIKFDWIEIFNLMSKQNFDVGYIKLKRYLQGNEIFRENFLIYLREMIILVFGLISGIIKSSELHGFKKKIADDLKKTYGFNTRNKSFESFESLLSIFLCRYIYSPIITPEFISELKKGPIELTELQIDKITNRLINEPIYNDWFIQLTNKKEDQFRENYTDFEERLKFDQLYNESYIESIHKLIKFIFDLVSWKVNVSELHGFEREIVNDLKKCTIFLLDPELSKIFKFNISIFYCRYFHQIIKYLEAKDIIKKNQKSLPATIIEPIVRGFRELPPYHKIRDEFLDDLNERSKEIFHQFYLKLRVRLKRDQIYYESYLEYLREQLNFVYAINKRNISELGQSNLERILIKELKNKPVDKQLSKELDQIFKDEQKSHINQYNHEKIIQDLRNKICNFIFSELNKKKTRKLTVKLIKKSFNLNPYLKALSIIGVDDYLAKNIEKCLIAVPLMIEPYFSKDKNKKTLSIDEIHNKSGLSIKQIQLISLNFEKTFGKNTYDHDKRFPELYFSKSTQDIDEIKKDEELKNVGKDTDLKQSSMNQRQENSVRSKSSIKTISIANFNPEMIKNEIISSIDKHIKTLMNHSIYLKFDYTDIKKRAISTYDAILNFIDDDKNKAHIILYNSLNGTKKPTYMAGALIFYILAKQYLTEDNKKILSKSNYCSALNIAESSFYKMFSSLYPFFQKLPNYEPTEYLFSIQSLSYGDYIFLVDKYIKKFVTTLNNSKNFNHSLKLKDEKILCQIFNDILESIDIDKKNALNLFFEKINENTSKKHNIKNPKYVSACLVYYYLAKKGFLYDSLHDNAKNKFFTQAYLEKELSLPNDSIVSLFKAIYDYLKNIKKYGVVYGLIDNDTYSFNDYKFFINQELAKLRISLELPEEVWNEVIIMFDIIINSFTFDEFYGYLKENNTTRPRDLFISLLYFSLIKYNYKMTQNELSDIFNVPRTNIALISSVIQEFLQKTDEYKFIQDHIYSNKLSKEDFSQMAMDYLSIIIRFISKYVIFKISSKRDIKKIKKKIIKVLKNTFNHKDFDDYFSKVLYRKTKKPVYFACVFSLIYLRYYNDVNIRISSYIETINNVDNFNINSNSFRVIYNSLTEKYFEKEEKQYQNRNAIRKKFYVYNKIEEFTFLEDNLENLANIHIKELLTTYFKDIMKGNIPDKFSKITLDTSRASKLFLKGTKDFQLFLLKRPNYTESEINIFDLLIKNGHLKTFDSHFILCKYVQDILDSHPLGLGYKRHKTILTEILLNFKKAVAIEIPIWKFCNLNNDYLLGHIDLLYVRGNCIYIADFKPIKEEIFRSLPQIAAYGKMILDKINDKNLIIKCISFNHQIAVQFDPVVMGNEVMKFVENTNNIRYSKGFESLKTKDNKLDLYEELKKFFQ